MLQRQFEIRMEGSVKRVNDSIMDIFDSLENVQAPEGLNIGGVRVSETGGDYGTGKLETKDPEAHLLRVAYVVDEDKINMDEEEIPEDVKQYVADFLKNMGMSLPQDFSFATKREEHTILFDGIQTDDPVVVEALDAIDME